MTLPLAPSGMRLSIAGTALEVAGPETWLATLRRAWSPWSAGLDNAPWQVSLAADATLSPPEGPLFEALPRSHAGICSLDAPGFVGRIVAADGRAELRAHPQATPADAGYFLRVTLALQAFAYGGLLFHAAGVVHRERGYALFGRSGSGKTTAAKLSAPAPVLNDDLVLLWPEPGGWQMYATPFGRGRGDRLVAPLRGLLHLVKAPDIALKPLRPSLALSELAANTPVLSGDPVWLHDALARWDGLLNRVPVWALHFRREVNFWEVIDVELG